MTAIIKICKFTVFSSGSFCQIYRATDEALIAETMVWPNFFLMNVFFALKGSKLFIIIYSIMLSANRQYANVVLQINFALFPIASASHAYPEPYLYKSERTFKAQLTLPTAACDRSIL